MRKRKGFLLLGLAVGLFVSHAHAEQDPKGPTDAQREEAKNRYQEGAAAYRKGQFKDAVDLFLEADRLAPSAALSFNIARAYEKLGDASNALRWYRDYLRRDPEASDRATVEQIVHKLEEKLKSKGVMQLTVLSQPKGATVVVDDRPVGVTPWTGDLAPGKHVVALRQRGFADTERQIELSAEHAQDLSVRLVPAPESVAKPATPVPEKSSVARSPKPQADTGSREAPGVGPLTWVTLGASVGALGAAGVFEWLRRDAEDEAREATTQVAYGDAFDTMQSRQTTARVLGGVGGALAVAGAVMLVIDLTSGGSETGPTTASLRCGDSGCWLTTAGRF